MLKNGRVLIVGNYPGRFRQYKIRIGGIYVVDRAETGGEGLLMLSHEKPYMAILSDYRLPDMTGLDFAGAASKSAPDSIRIILTDGADLETVIDAFNEGRIFRFLTPPCSFRVFRKALELGINQYHLLRKERILAETIKDRKEIEKAKERLKELLEERTGELIKYSHLLKQEIKGRQEAEEALRDWRNIFQLTLDNVSQCIFWKDANSAYLGANKNFARLVNLSDAGAIVGKTDDALDWSEAESLRAFGELAMEKDAVGFEVIEEFRENEDRTYYWDIGSFPYHDEEGTVMGVLCTLEDISDNIISADVISEDAKGRGERHDVLIQNVRALVDELDAPVGALAVSEEILSRAAQDASLYSYVKTVAEQTIVFKQILIKLKKITESSR